MSKETDSFLNNECIKTFIELSKKYPNNMELGERVRAFITELDKDKCKDKDDFTEKYLDK